MAASHMKAVVGFQGWSGNHRQNGSNAATDRSRSRPQGQIINHWLKNKTKPNQSAVVLSQLLYFWRLTGSTPRIHQMDELIPDTCFLGLAYESMHWGVLLVGVGSQTRRVWAPETLAFCDRKRSDR